MKQAGYRIRLSKELQVKHLKRWNIRSLLKSDFFDRALPWTELILRDRGFINDLNLRTSSRLECDVDLRFFGGLGRRLLVVWFFCCRRRICPLSHHPRHARLSVFPSEARFLVYDQDNSLALVLQFLLWFGLRHWSREILFLQAKIL